jgi:hypothetical protein
MGLAGDSFGADGVQVVGGWWGVVRFPALDRLGLIDLDCACASVRSVSV